MEHNCPVPKKILRVMWKEINQKKNSHTVQHIHIHLRKDKHKKLTDTYMGTTWAHTQLQNTLNDPYDKRIQHSRTTPHPRLPPANQKAHELELGAREIHLE